MAKLKMKKAPKAPKANASVDVKERYLKKLKEIEKENRRRDALNRKSEALTKKIQHAVAGFKK